jgi:2-methylcitrate dehydratase PrpD
LLARYGFNGPQDIIEGANGFARAYADGVDFKRITHGLGTDYVLREVTVKGHACSARVQTAVQGILDLCRKHRIDPDQIADILVGIPAVIRGRLTIPKPVDVQAAQMSLPHSAALAAAIGHAAEDGFALSVADYKRSLEDPRVKDIEKLVRCEVNAQVEAATTAEAVPACVTITLTDGAKHSIFVPAPKGSPSRPFSHDDLVARFRGELDKRFTTRACDQIVEIAENIGGLDKVRRLTDLLAVAPAGS